MRIAAIGDAHLGRSYYSFTDPETGVNRRERDFEISFETAVEAALAQRPDLVVWLGDIFDHPRPTYRSYRIAQRALARIRDHGLRCAVISGNHDTPRLPGMGSPYSALADAFPDNYWAHRLTYERFDLPGLTIHAVPQMLKVAETLEALEMADAQRSADRTNLLLTHPRLTQVEPRYADINEIELDQGALKADLVLLGHYHVHQRVANGMWYAGSPDSFSFADDPDQPKGIAVLDTDTGEFTHVPVEPQRRLETLETIHAAGLSPSELQAAVLERAGLAQPMAIARLFIDLVDPEVYRLLDTDAIHDAAAHTLLLKIEPQFAATSHEVQLPEIESLPGRWDRFLEPQDLLGYDRDRLRLLGHEYLGRAVEEAEP